MEKILYFDVETTGLDSKKCALIQIGGIIEIDGEIKEEINLTMSPTEEDEIDESALAVIGKTRIELFEYRNQIEVYSLFKKILEKYVDKYDKTDKFKLVAHNIQFDFNFLMEWARKNQDNYLGSLIDYKQQFCTFRVFQALKFLGLIENQDKLSNNKLQTLCDFLGIKLDDAHDAMADITATMKLYKWEKQFLEKLSKE